MTDTERALISSLSKQSECQLLQIAQERRGAALCIFAKRNEEKMNNAAPGAVVQSVSVYTGACAV